MRVAELLSDLTTLRPEVCVRPLYSYILYPRLLINIALEHRIKKQL
jgi:hypothetical protein